MRLLLSTALVLTLPGWAAAEDFVLRADIAQATVFGQGAQVTRTATLSLPAGHHRIVIPMRDVQEAALLQVRASDGVRVGAVEEIDALPVRDGALDSAVEAAARAEVEAAEDDLQTARDALTASDAAIRGFEAQLAFLTAVSTGGDGASLPSDLAALTQLLATLGSETTRLSQELHQARVDRRALEEVEGDARTELNDALQALEALNPFKGDVQAVAIPVEVEADMEAAFELSYLIASAEWVPSYELHLNSETGDLRVDRQIQFYYDGPAIWRDVAMRFSTANPNRQSAPSGVAPSPARIHEAMPQVRGGVAMESEALSLAPMVEPVVMVDDRAEMEVSGLSVSYRYADPVTVGANGTATLAFDSLALSAELENRAAPRFDQTAFLVAMTENTSGEPILPGEAVLYRDGDVIGDFFLPLYAPGAEVELAFGALDHLILTWQDLSRDEGDRGVFITENEQRRVVRFGVENTSDQPATVRLLYATPFSEQEDLDVDVQLSLAPDDRNVDDLRGVHAWDLDLAASGDALIEMQVELSWPEDQNLAWWP